MTDTPQIYLATPARFELSGFAAQLGALLDDFEIACVRLSLATSDEDELIRAADLLRETCAARDVAFVIDSHFRLARQLGLDGVHLTDGHRHLREARKLLGDDRIVGVFAGVSRHVGMNAGEMGADYVSFGPMTADGALGDGQTAPVELFRWWSEMIEVPVVAEGGISPRIAGEVSRYADFLCLGAEIWGHEAGPASGLGEILSAVSRGAVTKS